MLTLLVSVFNFFLQLPQHLQNSSDKLTQTDMKSNVVMVAIGDFIFMFLCLDMVLYIGGHFTFYMSHYLGWFVLYPRCRINRDTNLFVVCVLCNSNSCFHCARLGSECGVSNLWGASPLCCSPLCTIWFRSLATQLPSDENPPPPPGFSPPDFAQSVHLWRKICSKMLNNVTG